MPRKFSTKVLDTLLKSVEVELKIPFIVGEVKFPVTNNAKDWWANEKLRIDLLNAIEAAEQKFIINHPDEKVAQMWDEFPLYLDEDFQKVIAQLVKHLDEKQIITLAENTIKRNWKDVATKEEIQRALYLYLPYLRHELMGIKEFREIIDSLRLVLQRKVEKWSNGIKKAWYLSPITGK